MIDRSLVRRYVAAITGLAARDAQTDRVRQELAALQRAATADPRLLALLHHPQVPREEKRAVLLRLVGDQPSHIITGFVDILLEKERIEVLQAAADMFTALADEAAGVERARVEVVHPPDDAQSLRLREALSRAMGAPVVLDIELVPEVIGGARVHVGGRVIDGSLAGRIEQVLQHVHAAPMPPVWG